MLLRPGVNPNQKDKDGDAALHVFINSHRDDKVDLITTLLSHSCADVNLKTADDMTALHLAVRVSSTTCLYTCDLCVFIIIYWVTAKHFRIDASRGELLETGSRD